MTYNDFSAHNGTAANGSTKGAQGGQQQQAAYDAAGQAPGSGGAAASPAVGGGATVCHRRSLSGMKRHASLKLSSLLRTVSGAMQQQEQQERAASTVLPRSSDDVGRDEAQLAGSAPPLPLLQPPVPTGFVPVGSAPGARQPGSAGIGPAAQDPAALGGDRAAAGPGVYMQPCADDSHTLSSIPGGASATMHAALAPQRTYSTSSEAPAAGSRWEPRASFLSRASPRVGPGLAVPAKPAVPASIDNSLGGSPLGRPGESSRLLEPPEGIAVDAASITITQELTLDANALTAVIGDLRASTGAGPASDALPCAVASWRQAGLGMAEGHGRSSFIAGLPWLAPPAAAAARPWSPLAHPASAKGAAYRAHGASPLEGASAAGGGVSTAGTSPGSWPPMSSTMNSASFPATTAQAATSEITPQHDAPSNSQALPQLPQLQGQQGAHTARAPGPTGGSHGQGHRQAGAAGLWPQPAGPGGDGPEPAAVPPGGSNDGISHAAAGPTVAARRRRSKAVMHVGAAVKDGLRALLGLGLGRPAVAAAPALASSPGRDVEAGCASAPPTNGAAASARPAGVEACSSSCGAAQAGRSRMLALPQWLARRMAGAAGAAAATSPAVRAAGGSSMGTTAAEDRGLTSKPRLLSTLRASASMAHSRSSMLLSRAGAQPQGQQPSGQAQDTGNSSVATAERPSMAGGAGGSDALQDAAAGCEPFSKVFNARWVPAPAATAPGAVLALRGLRVRVGMHSGITSESELQYNRASARVVYAGQALQLAKSVADAAHGGCITLTHACFLNLTHWVVNGTEQLLLFAGRHVVKVRGASCAACSAGAHAGTCTPGCVCTRAYSAGAQAGCCYGAAGSNSSVLGVMLR